MLIQLTNEQVFKLVCMEVIETMGVNTFTPIAILHNMTKPDFIDWCEHAIFVNDDGELDEGEIFLLDWMKQKVGNWHLINELMPVAERLELKFKR